MPSPVAHTLAGMAVAHFAFRRRAAPPGEPPLSKIGRSRLEQIFWTVSLVFAANAADLDFLPGVLLHDPNRFHHGPTHTLIATLAFGLLATALAGMAGFGPWRRFGLLMGLGYFTHLVLDFVTHGNKEPYGMKILWPFSSRPVMTPFHVFLDIRRDPMASSFLPSLVQWHNAEAVAWELAVIAGIWLVYRAISSLQFTLNTPGRKTPTGLV